MNSIFTTKTFPEAPRCLKDSRDGPVTIAAHVQDLATHNPFSGSRNSLQGTKNFLRESKNSLRGVNIVFRDTKCFLRESENSLRGANIVFQDTKYFLRETMKYLWGIKIVFPETNYLNSFVYVALIMRNTLLQPNTLLHSKLMTSSVSNNNNLNCMVKLLLPQLWQLVYPVTKLSLCVTQSSR